MDFLVRLSMNHPLQQRTPWPSTPVVEICAVESCGGHSVDGVFGSGLCAVDAVPWGFEQRE